MQQVVVIKPNQPENIELNLDNVNQDQELYVFFVGKNSESYTLSTLAKHAKQNTKSLTIVRGVLYDRARANIDGMIEIRSKITGCNAFLDQKILLIGDEAKADIKPMLEIKNNEVKASHAASVGKLDQEQLLYLMSRGLNRAQASTEMVKGFFQNIIGRIENKELRNKIEKELQ